MASFREKTDEFVISLKKNITSILLDVGIIGVAIAYVFYNILEFHKTDLDPWRLLMKGLVGIFVGVGLKWMLGEKGIIKGHNNEQFTRPKEHFDNRTEKAVPYIDKYDAFEEKERTEKIYRNRKIHLNNYKMKYETFFDENGDYIEHEIWTPQQRNKWLKQTKKSVIDFGEEHEDVIVLDLRQRLVLRKCIKLQIFVPNVFDDYGNSITDDEKPQKTERDIRKQNTRNNFVSAVVFALIGVYFIPDIMNFTVAGIIWSIFQVFMWLAFGIINFYKNYTFVVIDEVKYIGKKDKLLTKFLIYALGGRDQYENLMNPKVEEPKETVIELTKEQADALLKGVEQ